MTSSTTSTAAVRSRGRIAAVIALSVGALGFVAFVTRPFFPAPVVDVSAFLPGAVPPVPWDRLYVSRAAVTVLRPALLLLLVTTGPGRRTLRRLTSWMSPSTLGAALAAVDVLVVIDLVTLPIAWWGHIGTQAAATWFAGWFLMRAQTWALVGLLAAGITLAIRRWPSSWHWRSAVVVGIVAAMIPLAADLDPFAGGTRPLDEGPIRETVEAAAARAGGSDVPLLVGSGAAASELGAYVSGIGPSRSIVFSSALLDGFPPEQVAFVAMHEFAHREQLDVYRKVLGTAAGLVVGFWVLRVVLRSGHVRRRMEEAPAPGVERVVIALAVAVVIHTLAAPVSNLATRRSEAAADWGALEATGDPASAIAVHRYLLEAGGSDPHPPTWYQAWLATHPTAAERIGLAVRYAELNGIQLTR